MSESAYLRAKWVEWKCEQCCASNSFSLPAVASPTLALSMTMQDHGQTSPECQNDVYSIEGPRTGQVADIVITIKSKAKYERTRPPDA